MISPTRNKRLTASIGNITNTKKGNWVASDLFYSPYVDFLTEGCPQFSFIWAVGFPMKTTILFRVSVSPFEETTIFYLKIRRTTTGFARWFPKWNRGSCAEAGRHQIPWKWMALNKASIAKNNVGEAKVRHVPLGLCQVSAIETIEIVNCPIKSDDFPVRYVTNYQRVNRFLRCASYTPKKNHPERPHSWIWFLEPNSAFTEL